MIDISMAIFQLWQTSLKIHNPISYMVDRTIFSQVTFSHKYNSNHTKAWTTCLEKKVHLLYIYSSVPLHYEDSSIFTPHYNHNNGHTFVRLLKHAMEKQMVIDSIWPLLVMPELSITSQLCRFLMLGQGLYEKYYYCFFQVILKKFRVYSIFCDFFYSKMILKNVTSK